MSLSTLRFSTLSAAAVALLLMGATSAHADNIQINLTGSGTSTTGSAGTYQTITLGAQTIGSSANNTNAADGTLPPSSTVTIDDSSVPWLVATTFLNSYGRQSDTFSGPTDLFTITTPGGATYVFDATSDDELVNGSVLISGTLAGDFGPVDGQQSYAATLQSLSTSSGGESSGTDLIFKYTGDPMVNGSGTTVAATPEPSSFVLLGTGVAGFAGVVRRRFQK